MTTTTKIEHKERPNTKVKVTGNDYRRQGTTRNFLGVAGDEQKRPPTTSPSRDDHVVFLASKPTIISRPRIYRQDTSSQNDPKPT